MKAVSDAYNACCGEVKAEAETEASLNGALCGTLDFEQFRGQRD